MSKKSIKFENVSCGIKVVKSIENNGCNWNIGNKVYNLFTENLAPDLAFNPKAKNLKDCGLSNITLRLEECYWNIVEYKSSTKPSKEVVLKMQKSIYQVLFELGAIETYQDGTHRDFLWSEEFHLFLDLVAITASSKKVFMKDGNRTDVTSVASFKRAFWNAYYLCVSGKDLINLSSSKEAMKTRFEKRLAKNTDKSSLEKVNNILSGLEKATVESIKVA